MNTEEIQARVKAFEAGRADAGRIDWYDRNVPIWWKGLRDLFADPVWEGNSLLDDFCARWFEHSETEMRVFLDLPVSGTQLGTKIIELKPEKPGKPDLVLEPKESFVKKPLSAAERARLYRERKKMEDCIARAYREYPPPSSP